MRRFLKPALLILFPIICFGCSPDEVQPSPLPALHTLVLASDVSQNSATLTALIDADIVKNPEGNYVYEGYIVRSVGFAFTTDTTKHIRYWQTLEKLPDSRTEFSLNISGLAPGTTYYVKSMFSLSKKPEDQLSQVVFTDDTFDFTSLP